MPKSFVSASFNLQDARGLFPPRHCVLEPEVSRAPRGAVLRVAKIRSVLRNLKHLETMHVTACALCGLGTSYIYRLLQHRN